MQDFLDLDTQKKVRYVSESSNNSGYSTMSPGANSAYVNSCGNQSPASSNFSTSSSPLPSPASLLQSEFSQLNLPSSSVASRSGSGSGSVTPTRQFGNLDAMSLFNNNFSGFSGSSGVITVVPQHHHMSTSLSQLGRSRSAGNNHKYPAMLRIIEHPVEKFRFRYKSEMHGTHGSLNGASSKRSPKTFPEVELRNFNSSAIIRCSLFQANLDSPHSHQLVVRREDVDICDPHDVKVSPELGFVAQFQNMGIIHTAKKFIFDELLKKKLNRLQFELGHSNLSTKQMQQLHKETGKEAKDMNLNQVRLCFEAFKIEEDSTWTRIAAPVFTNPINNRKSAQTGELRICRLSIATGYVTGGDDLILLVEKVSKKNIKVRFYETNEDDEIVWEAFGKFRESDVHHQYAIVCQTPPYKNKDIDRTIEVFIELVRPSDDERSFPVTFRYKPRDAVASRKRRRTCSTATSSSGSGSSLSSFELPKPLQEQVTPSQTPTPTNALMAIQTSVVNNNNVGKGPYAKTISEEFNKDNVLQNLICSDEFRELIDTSSEELRKLCTQNYSIFDIESDLNTLNCLQTDGALEADGCNSATPLASSLTKSAVEGVLNKNSIRLQSKTSYFMRIFKIYDEYRGSRNQTADHLAIASQQVSDIFEEFIQQDEQNDTLIHEIISKDNPKLGMKLFDMLDFLKLEQLCKRVNSYGQNALHYACLSDRAHYIRPLLRRGCDPNSQDHHGNTPLHVAVYEQHQKCVESFLNVNKPRMNLTIKNDKGRTALHEAIHLLPDIAAKLLQQDKSLAFVIDNKNGNNALHMAVLMQNTSLVELIVNAQEGNENILKSRNSAGHTALDLSKTLSSKEGDGIYEFLSQRCQAIDQKLVIKVEELSSSSGEEDEDSSLEPTEAVGMITIKRDDDLDEEYESLQLPTKTEILEAEEETVQKSDGEDCEEMCVEAPVNNTDANTGSGNENGIEKGAGIRASRSEPDGRLSIFLHNEEYFEELVDRLRADSKWTKVAEQLKLKHFVFLWQNAKTMLHYVRLNTHTITWSQFQRALDHVDAMAAAVMRNSPSCSSPMAMAEIIDGKAIAAQIRSEMRKEVEEYIAAGNRAPQLTAVLVGEDQASQTYVRMKMEAAKEIGIASETKRLPVSITEQELLDLIQQLNNDTAVDGILVQLPVPEHMDERKICNAVSYDKDVDGFNEINVGRMCLDMKSMIPATPLGVMELLKRTGIDTFGKNAVVVGRSKNVSMPIAMLLHTDGRHEIQGMDATVTICHRFTPPKDLTKFCQRADIIVTATGVPGIIKKDMIKPGACVIDVGITRITDEVTGRTKLVGDVEYEEVRQVAGYITPVPGGVGPMTVAMLMRNTLTAAKNLAKSVIPENKD